MNHYAVHLKHIIIQINYTSILKKNHNLSLIMTKLGKLARLPVEISTTSDTQMILMAEYQEEIKSLLMRRKRRVKNLT